MKITAKTKKLGIIGYPVEHSFSPVMHNYISEKIGADYVYSGYSVKPENLKDAIAGMRALGISGINVTAPHKIEVMKYIDTVTDTAKKLGSVNTIVNRDGELTGYNTDSEGFYMALTHAGIKIAGSSILVFGCGGVVKPTLMRIIDAKPKSITVVNRTKEKAEKLKEELQKSTGFVLNTKPDNMEYDIVLNTTSAGMEPQEDALPIDSIDEINNLDFINNNTAAVDMIYNPPCTRFLAEAKKRGAQTLNGLDMLIYQGIIAYELFTGIKLPENMADMIRKDVFGN